MYGRIGTYGILGPMCDWDRIPIGRLRRKHVGRAGFPRALTALARRSARSACGSDVRRGTCGPAGRAEPGARIIPDLRPADRRIFPAATPRKREKARAPEDYASRAAPTKSSRAPAAASRSSRKPM